MKRNFIINMLKDVNQFQNVKESFFYAFPDISKEYLIKFIADLQSLSIDTDDSDIASLVYVWYKDVPSSELIGFEMDDHVYNDSKVSNIVDLLTPFCNTLNCFTKLNKLLIDIGCGDGKLTQEVCDKLNMVPYGLDIESKVYWGNYKKNDINDIKLHYYDGKNFPSDILNSKFKIAMYNHSLHHFESFESQINSFKQISRLLDENGLIFIKEHDYKSSNSLLDLAHILLFLRYSININIINSASVASKSLSVYKNKFGDGTYLTESLLTETMLSLGFYLKIIRKQTKYSNDLNNIYYCFVRTN